MGNRKLVKGNKTKPSIAKLKKKCWSFFSRYIRLRDSLKTMGVPDRCKCCTCGGIFETWHGSCIQAGHFAPASHHSSVYFYPKAVHGQCPRCNKWLNGNWPKYLEFMQKEYGQQTIDFILKERNFVHKWTRDELELIIDKAKKFLDDNGVV
jgi:hypothetical protein